MVERLDAHWLTAPPVRAVMAALEAARPGGSRFVGGCVRNTLMGRPVDDIDIATQLTPGAVTDALEAAGLRVIPTGIEHGTVTAIAAGRPFEITTLRRDVETDGRRAVVAFTEDWAEDAGRRDFRLNALYADADGTLHDPTGGGLADAKAGRVIFIGDADERLREDYLRILRFFRFNAWYGAGIDPEGLAACERQREGLAKIAAERIWKEFKRLLEAPDPSEALGAMHEIGVLALILGAEGGGVADVARLISAERAHKLEGDAMRRLMVLLPREQAELEALSERLRLSNREGARLKAWADPGLPALGDAPAPEVRAGIYRHGAEAVLDRALVGYARGEVKLSQDFLTLCATWQRPDFPLGGEDAKAAGLEGPEIGRALRAVERWWVEQDFHPDRAELLNRLQQTKPPG